MNEVSEIIRRNQVTEEGGVVIAVQVENEVSRVAKGGSFDETRWDEADLSLSRTFQYYQRLGKDGRRGDPDGEMQWVRRESHASASSLSSLTPFSSFVHPRPLPVQDRSYGASEVCVPRSWNRRSLDVQRRGLQGELRFGSRVDRSLWLGRLPSRLRLVSSDFFTRTSL